jgi:hypothetical protein
MGARFYAPSAGAWTSLDTYAGSAANPASLNRFVYVEGNPASLIDPTGHMARDGQICDARYDQCVGTRITGASTGNTIKGKANRNATYCAMCAASGDSHVFQAPDPTAIDQQPTMTDWQVWWRTASPEDRRLMQGLLFGREFADETNPEAPPDVVCMGRDNGDSQMCRTIQLVSTLIHSADSAFVIAGAYGMVGTRGGGRAGDVADARAWLEANGSGSPRTPLWGSSATARGVVADATAAVGRKGSTKILEDGTVIKYGGEIPIPRGTNAPGQVSGRPYSGHAFDQMQARGLTPTVVEDAIANGSKGYGSDGSIVYYSALNDISVVVSKEGVVITAGYGTFKPH